MKKTLIILVSSLYCCTLFLEAQGVSYNQEFQVNTYTNYDQEKPSVSYLMDGGFVVCWESYYQEGSNRGIFGQRFNDNGSKRGAEFQINNFIYNVPENPSVSYLADSGFVVCWESWNQDKSDYEIIGQLFNGDGYKRGSEFQVNTYTESTQSNPSVSYLNNGGFVVCWQSWGQDGGYNGIFCKYYLKEIKHELIPFSLREPANDIALTTTNPLFKWSQATSMRINLPWELEYHIYLDENEDFSTPRIIKAIYDTTYTVDSLIPGTTYYWKVLAKNIEGDSLWSSETYGFFVSYDAVVGIEETIMERPSNFKLFTNYPNPFNPKTTIKYSLPTDQAIYDVKIWIYDALGRLVMVLKNEQQKPGIYTMKWNGQNAAGETIPTGVYFCVVQAGPYKAVQKILLIR